MEYHKIETLYARDENFKVQPGVLKNPAYSLVNFWHFTEKVDGTNIRLQWIDEKFSIGGRTDNAQLPADLLTYLHQLVDPATLAEVFPDRNTIIYGEGYGAGIQKGGALSATKKFIAFDVLVFPRGEERGARGYWLERQNVEDVCARLGIRVVPELFSSTLETATKFVREGFYSQVAETPQTPAEGLVGRPAHTLYDAHGKRLIVKLKTKDFS